MSGNEDNSNELSEDGLAFEYVSGTLRGEERANFEAELRDNPRLQADVHFWEEQLMASHENLAPREPSSASWTAIESSIRGDSSAAETKANSWFASPWKLSALAFSFAWVLTLALWIGGQGSSGVAAQPNADYVAVLTAENGEAMLTALTSVDGKQLWLKWESEPNTEDQSMQLWAQSRRDGQIRPLFVFDETQSSLVLDEANYRLIRDSSYLILTAEEPGGSAIDEPSDELIAKGVCVRLDDRA